MADLPESETVLVKRSSDYYLIDLTEWKKTLAHSEMPDSLIQTQHALIDAVRLAYATHRPLVLSPDIVWLTIERAFAKHVDLHADSLRSMFVSFEGKETLAVETFRPLWLMTSRDWEKCVRQFPRQIAQWTGEELVETLHCDFSTTTPTSLTASDIMIMSSMQHYFEYEVFYFCGIPDIYLEGTPEDWQKILVKARALRKYRLDWWIDELEPILEKIAAASAGERDIVFWQSIFHQVDEQQKFMVGCGDMVNANKLDGWIQTFYPYWNDTLRTSDCIYEAEIQYLPVELGSAPLTFVHPNGKRASLHVYAGLAGIAEDKDTHALRPEIVWLISSDEIDYLQAIPYIWKGMDEEHIDSTSIQYGTSVPYEISYDIPTEIDVSGSEYESDKVFMIVEQMPEFPGGQVALFQYIQDNVHHPHGYDPDGAKVRVIMQFVVEKDGTLTNIEVVRSLDNGGGYDQEAIRVIESMPKWNPGRQRGERARVKYTVPITFKIPQDEKNNLSQSL